MITVSVRELQKNVGKIIEAIEKGDSLVITRYNVPYAKIEKYELHVQPHIQSYIQPKEKTAENKIVKRADTGEWNEFFHEIVWEWCKANVTHPFEVGKLYKCLYLTYEGVDGGVGVLNGKKYEKVYICLDCFHKLESQITEGGFNWGGESYE